MPIITSLESSLGRESEKVKKIEPQYIRMEPKRLWSCVFLVAAVVLVAKCEC